MTTISDKFNRAFASKEAIRQALISKGVDVPGNTPFADYAKKINDITVGDDNNPYQQLYMQRTANETSMKGLFAYTPASSTLDLSMMNTSQVTDMSYMFSECKVPYLDLSGFDVGNVTNMERMFSYCTSEINIDGWDTSKLTNASSLFYNFTNNNKYLDLSVLDFSNITKSDNMFEGCNVDNIDIRNLNLNLTKLSALPFRSVKGTVLDLSNYDITGLTSTYYLCYFCGCKTIDLTNWKTTEVTDMKQTFYYCSDIQKIIMPDWDMTNVTNTSNFFYSCSKLNYIDLSRSNDATIAKIATLVPAQKLATYGQILIPADSSQANIDALIAKYWKPVGPRLDMTSCDIILELDEIKPGKSTKLYYYNQEPWYGNDASVEYISSDESVATVDGNIITSTGIEGTTEIMARIADTQEVIGSTTLAVSEIDSYPNVIKFRGTKSPGTNDKIKVNGKTIGLNTGYVNYNALTDIYTYDAKAPITSVEFDGHGNSVSTRSCYELIKINTSNMTTMERMFSGQEYLAELDLSDFDTSKVTNMKYMFEACYTLKDLDVSSFDTSNVTDMYGMFSYCKSLTELDLSSFNTSNVTDMNNMFYQCSKLTQLDLSNFDTSNVNRMQYMFHGCNSLTSLNISNFDMSKCTKGYKESMNDDYYMFGNCISLHTLRLDNCSNDTISKIINSIGFPTNEIEGITRKIYCKEENAAGLIAPDGWEFIYVDSNSPEMPPIIDPELPGMPGIGGGDEPEVTPEPEPSVPEEGEPSEPTGTYVISFSTLGSKKLTVNNVDVTDQVVETGGYGDTISCKYETTDVIRQASFKDNTDLVRVFGLDTSMMFHTEEMFSGCTNLVAILPMLDSSMAYSTRAMFKNCTSLTSMDTIGSFSAASNKSEMFYNCTSLTGTVPSWNYWLNGAVTEYADCFYNCTALDNYSDIPASWGGPNN
jgi:surface protein